MTGLSGKKRALLLLGSPRPQGNSESLADAFSACLSARGWETAKRRAITALGSPSEMQTLVQDVWAADLLVLSSPLYADGVPGVVLRVFEEIIAGAVSGRPAGQKPGMIAIFNCGFPEAHQNNVALEICRLFANEAGFHWSGGLAMGMGEMLGRRPLGEVGRKVRPVRKALDLAAEALAQGGDIPEEAVKLMASPVLPKWLYLLGGNWAWRREARRNGLSVEALAARPFE